MLQEKIAKSVGICRDDVNTEGVDA